MNAEGVLIECIFVYTDEGDYLGKFHRENDDTLKSVVPKAGQDRWSCQSSKRYVN